MRHEDWSRLNEMVVAAARALLSSAGEAATYAGCRGAHEGAWADTISIIGLGGGTLRGSVVLSVPAPVLARTHPAGATGDDDLADWLAELANLLLGNLKRQLLARGVAVEMSTPITLSASSLRFHRFKGLPVTHAFALEGGEALVMFEAIGEERAELSPEPDASVALGEGEVVLF